MVVPGPSPPFTSCLINSESAFQLWMLTQLPCWAAWCPVPSRAPEAAAGETAVATASKIVWEQLHSTAADWQCWSHMAASCENFSTASFYLQWHLQCHGALFSSILPDKSVKMTLAMQKELDDDKRTRRIVKTWRLFLAGFGSVLQRYFRKIPAVGVEYLEYLEHMFKVALNNKRSLLPGWNTVGCSRLCKYGYGNLSLQYLLWPIS